MEMTETAGMSEFDRRWAEAEERMFQAMREELLQRKTRKQLRMETYRTACRWIVPRLPELLAAGWTVRTLFGIGRGPSPFRGWGTAWLSVWGKAAEVELGPGGEITFTIHEPNRSVHQTARPMA